MARLTALSLYGLALFALAGADTSSDATPSTPVSDSDTDITATLGSTNIIPGRYIVQFEPSAATTATSLTDNDIASILSESGVDLEVQYTYVNPNFNAASIVISGNDTQPIQGLDAVAKVWPVSVMKIPGWKGESMKGQGSLRTPLSARDSPNPPQNPPRENLAHSMTGVDRAHRELNLRGQGMKIGIVDSGIDYNHTAFGACFKTPGCRIQYGSDLVGNDYDGDTNPVAIPNPYPYDACIGHGTHVAGIVAGSDGVYQGVAPNATLGIYKVFGCAGEGSVGEDAIMLGMQAAANDGMDVINVSAGEPGQWAASPASLLANALSLKGITVMASNGNFGLENLYADSDPSVGTAAFSVSSHNPIYIWANTLNVTAAGRTTQILRANDYSFPWPAFVYSGTPLRRVADSAGKYTGCGGYATEALKGLIVQVDQTSDCSADDQVDFAAAAGATGILFAMPTQNLPRYLVFGAPHEIAIGMVTLNDGNAILAMLKANPQGVTVTSDDELRKWRHTDAGQVSLYSSYGPDPELKLKPELSAPGDRIYSTYPLYAGGYDNLSGTSMSTPVLTGVAALMKQYGIPAASLKQRLMQTATPYCFNSTLCDTVTTQGSGIINIMSALYSPVFASLNAFALNDTINGKFSGGVTNRQTVFTNRSKQTVRINLSAVQAYSVSAHYANQSLSDLPRRNTQSASVTFSHSVLNLAPGQSTSWDVAFTQPRDLPDKEHWVYSGFINATIIINNAVNSTLTIPYLGFKGDYRTVPILRPNTAEFPYLGSSQTNAAVTQAMSANAAGCPVFDMVNSLPTLTVAKDHPTAQIRVYVTNQATGKTYYAFVNDVLDYAQQNFISYRPSTTFTWNGYGYTKPSKSDLARLANGIYRMKITALRPFGNPNNATDLDSWTSAYFRVSR
ncbi:hypothetical protein IWQ60_007360 [Tieghemiomyces parasiticus]|uniref:Uncharacterized protein n=1 Tax=Tieghemiomyces parasiticus TaxID=78921 RepID=A0A9W7ZY05_9FUNG|nr:hypothetical protein IWQ60_007360 [Tieghemiomyces parasiticus]